MKNPIGGAMQHPALRIPTVANTAAFARRARETALALPIYDGDIEQNKWIVEAARWYITEHRCLAILTRDNMVRLGFWKNDQYENCLHLSLSFRLFPTFEPIGWDARAAEQIVRAVFGAGSRKVWWEPAYSPRGKVLSVGHFRLFFTPDWSTSIVPKGEPYSVSSEMGGTSMRLWTEAQAGLATPNFYADITDELPQRRAEP